MPPVDPSKANVLAEYADRLRAVCPIAPADDMACANLLANGFWDCRLCGGYEGYKCLDYGVQPYGPYIEPLNLMTGVRLTDEQMQPIIAMTANSINMNASTGGSSGGGGGGSSFVAVAGPVRYESSTTAPSAGSAKEIITGLKEQRKALCLMLGGNSGGDFTLDSSFFGDLGYVDGLTVRQNSENSYAGGGRRYPS